jgi:hypothetical protein
MNPATLSPGTGFPPEGEVLALDDEVVSYPDLAQVAAFSHAWEPFLRRSARGAYLAARQDVDEAALRQAAERFRRERDLVAADDLRSWLEARSLDRSDWQGALVRSLLLAANEDAAGPSGSGGQMGGQMGYQPGVGLPGDADAAGTERLRADAFCSGLWARHAHQAADWLTARRLSPGLARPSGLRPSAAGTASVLAVSPGRAEAIESWRDAYEAVRAGLVQHGPITQVIRQRELDWTSFDVEELVLGTEPAAREALMLSRDDGMDLEDIRRRSGGRVDTRRSRADSLPPALAAELLAAPIDQGVVGPVRRADGWGVMWLRDRHRPSAADDNVRHEAAEGLLRETLDREMVGHLRWLGPV